MVLFLSENDVQKSLRMSEAVDIVDAAFREQGEGGAMMLPRLSQMLPGTAGAFRVISAVLPERGMFGLKTLTGLPGKRLKDEIYFAVLLFETGSGALRAVISANYLTGIRTGAASGAAARYMAREDAASIGVIGSGVQAWYQVEALCAVRDIDSVKVFSPNADHASDLVDRIQGKLHVDAQAVSSAYEAVRDSDLIVTATTASTPVVMGEWLSPGMHISAVGANAKTKRELDAECFRRGYVVADAREQVLEDSGDLRDAVATGDFPSEIVHAELSDLSSGKKEGRTSADQITIFKSIGVALQDVAVAAYLFSQAEKQGIGTWLDPHTLNQQMVIAR